MLLFVYQRLEAAALLADLPDDLRSGFIKSRDFDGVHESARHVTASETITSEY